MRNVRFATTLGEATPSCVVQLHLNKKNSPAVVTAGETLIDAAPQGAAHERINWLIHLRAESLIRGQAEFLADRDVRRIFVTPFRVGGELDRDAPVVDGLHRAG